MPFLITYYYFLVIMVRCFVCLYESWSLKCLYQNCYAGYQLFQ